MCSGYGGLDMGVRAVLGGTVAWHAEMNPNAAQILAHHWPRDAEPRRHHRS
jgi:site-specific DNA-cytosine methylase